MAIQSRRTDMKAQGNKGATFALGILLGGFGVLLVAAEPSGPAPGWVAGVELLVNGGFEGPVKLQIPSGWFRSMMPEQTENLRAGIEEIPQRGNVAFIEQSGVKIRLVNNWGQRIQTIPIGATVQVTADVKTENMPADTGFVMVQCWDHARRLIGGASSQSVEPIGGTEDWKRVSFEFVVPPDTDAMILRCGLAQSGRIWFDNLSMKVVSPVAAGRHGASQGRGFEVTERSLGQLERVTAFSDGLVAYAQQELGAGARVRREVFAQGGGQFQVVLRLDLSQPE
jgi:hypothetical protein